MSHHLPECPSPTEHGGGEFGIYDERPCICDRLRACEQRVTGQAYRNGYARGLNERDAALSAARDAVAALIDVPRPMPLRDAIAAIDALRGTDD